MTHGMACTCDELNFDRSTGYHFRSNFKLYGVRCGVRLTALTSVPPPRVVFFLTNLMDTLKKVLHTSLISNPCPGLVDYVRI